MLVLCKLDKYRNYGEDIQDSENKTAVYLRPRNGQKTLIFPLKSGMCFFRSSIIFNGCFSLTSITAFSICRSSPSSSDFLIKALTSLGKQLPPNPIPALKNDGFILCPNQHPQTPCKHQSQASCICFLSRWRSLSS